MVSAKKFLVIYRKGRLMKTMFEHYGGLQTNTSCVKEMNSTIDHDVGANLGGKSTAA